MPTWITIHDAVTFVLSSATGLYALWRGRRQEKTILKFTLVPSDTREEEYGDSTFSIQITATNEGGRPVTIKAFGCDYAYSTVSGTAQRKTYCPVNKKIDLGEACPADLQLTVKPWTADGSTLARSDIVSISHLYALDTTDKEWQPSPTVMRTFRTAAYQIWDLQNPFPNPSKWQWVRFWQKSSGL
jgi:hypothetical protein